MHPDDVYIDNPPVGGPGIGGPGGGGPGGGGLLNPTVPTFRGPGYQDWTRFMPTNFQLAEGGGMHYQPWVTGGAGMGGGNGGWITGPPFTGGGGTTGGGIGTNPNIWGGGGTTTTNTGAKPGSDKANDLANGITHHPEMYDHNDMWIGAEGEGVRSASTDAGTGWQNVPGMISAIGNMAGWNPAYPGVTNPIAPGFTTTTAPGYDYTMTLPANTAYGPMIIDSGYGPEGADGQGESEADIEADIEASRDGGVVA